jgi:hypothetical protein
MIKTKIQTNREPSPPFAHAILPRDPIVKENLEVLYGDELANLLGEESRGGNAGVFEIGGENLSCAAANGYADKATGAIIAFGNQQHVDPEIVANNGHFTLLMALSMRTAETQIVDSFIDSSFSDEARLRLERSVALRNAHEPYRAKEEMAQLRKEFGSKVMRIMGVDLPVDQAA